MNPTSSPLVSVITPVYNNAEHIEECIESVLRQTYQNWDYTIINNCSTDGSAEIARRYAAMDPRIRVVDNQRHLRAIENHNRSLREISPASKYCKMVFADDWIYPECIEKMVGVAEQYPSVGIVGAYGMQGRDVMWTGLPYPSPCISGRELCRLLLLKELYVFGTATSLLYRSDLVRAHDPFYNEDNLHADMETCVVLMKEADFGFVHQILTFKRLRSDSLGSMSDDINTVLAGQLQNLVAHGRDFLTPDEFEDCFKRFMSSYYNFLAVRALQGRRDDKFWKYHRKKLVDAGLGFSRARVALAMIARVFRGAGSLVPALAARKQSGARL
jgi:glycosyltransferase involved in cell wall biosynthesis